MSICDFIYCLSELIWHILPSLTTVIFAGFLLQKFFVSKSNSAHFIDSIISELQNLKSDSSEYWNSPYSSNDSKLSANLKGSLHTINADIIYFCKRYSQKSNFSILLLNLMDCVTGGEFESKKRKSDHSRYLTIVNEINKLKSELQKTKI